MPESIGSLRRRVSEFAEEFGAPRRKVSDIALAVSEACTNAVVHAYRGQPGKVSLFVEAGAGELLVKVVDEGDGLAPRPDSPGLGLGLPLIARVADRFEVHPGPDGRGTELCMVFRV